MPGTPASDRRVSGVLHLLLECFSAAARDQLSPIAHALDTHPRQSPPDPYESRNCATNRDSLYLINSSTRTQSCVIISLPGD